MALQNLHKNELQPQYTHQFESNEWVYIFNKTKHLLAKSSATKTQAVFSEHNQQGTFSLQVPFAHVFLYLIYVFWDINTVCLMVNFDHLHMDKMN